MFFNAQVSHLISEEKSSFSGIEDRTEDKETHKWAATEVECSKALEKHDPQMLVFF